MKTKRDLWWKRNCYHKEKSTSIHALHFFLARLTQSITLLPSPSVTHSPNHFYFPSRSHALNLFSSPLTTHIQFYSCFFFPPRASFCLYLLTVPHLPSLLPCLLLPLPTPLQPLLSHFLPVLLSSSFPLRCRSCRRAAYVSCAEY